MKTKDELAEKKNKLFKKYFTEEFFWKMCDELEIHKNNAYCEMGIIDEDLYNMIKEMKDEGIYRKGTFEY